MSAEINQATEKILPKVVEWRRHLHQYPELGNREFKTAAYIENHLRRLGWKFARKSLKLGSLAF
jgi:amidohydrolase